MAIEKGTLPSFLTLQTDVFGLATGEDYASPGK